MVKAIFSLVAKALYKIGRILNLSYNEINIIVYFFLIPFSWTILVDIWIGNGIASLCFLLFSLIIFKKKQHCFPEWCDILFYKSVVFLKWFNCFGSNYILSSVIICVLIPILVYGFLIYLIC